MRISLHIVVALLLIALIYREILKGILPPVCGNHWQSMHCVSYRGLLICAQGVLFFYSYLHICYISLFIFLYTDCLTLCLVAMVEKYLLVSSPLFTLPLYSSLQHFYS